MSASRSASFDDPVLARIAATVPLPPLDASGDVFHDLVGCLVEQQHPARSTKGTYARALARAGLDRLTPATFDRFEREALAGLRLSAAKRAALAAVPDAFHDAPDWAALPDDEVRACLGALRGVGPWTVDVIRLWTLGHPDVLPAGDYHLTRAVARLYGLGASGQARALREVADGWRPERSLAVRTVLAWARGPGEGL